jgi:mRNA interferase HigB
MKVNLVKKTPTIDEYAKSNARSKPSFAIWLTVVKSADWSRPEDIQQTFGTADLLGNGTNRVIFNIGGNNYRMICKYQFGKKKAQLFIKWIGTHAEYTKLCAKKEQYSVSLY